MKKHKKPLICKNCLLYDAKEKVCKVVVMDKGEKMELQTKPEDRCMWEMMGVDVHRIRSWSDGENGFLEWTELEKEGEAGV